uniref:hypothetical protein n=1 Tax=Herbidospora sakaeratensis TaxID=564415 RepID=UPI000784520E|nr:hypothetical protein [Herbidospora sakaeratensis]
MAADGFAVRDRRVYPDLPPAPLADLVTKAHEAAWPVWLDPGPRMLRDVLDLSRLQAARALAVLTWLAEAHTPDDVTWLLSPRRLTGPRQDRMYGEAARLPAPVLNLVVANWTWVQSTPHGGRVTAPYLAGTAYPDDGYAAAHAAITLAQIHERHPEARPALSVAWAACRTAADWCKAAELRATHGGDAPVFAYPRGPDPVTTGMRPWIARLLKLV